MNFRNLAMNFLYTCAPWHRPPHLSRCPSGGQVRGPVQAKSKNIKHEGHKGYKGKTFGFIRITSFPLCSLVRQDKPGWSSGLKGVHRMKYS